MEVPNTGLFWYLTELHLFLTDKTLTSNFIVFSCSGNYDFELTNPTTGEVAIAHARFTYVFDSNESKEWKIRTHHSSLLPVTAAEATNLNLRSSTTKKASQDLSWINQDLYKF